MRTAALICALAISGCCTQHPSDIAPEPEKRISLQDAFESAAEGISKFRQTLSKNNVTLGVVVCKIEVSFNVSAEATAGNTAGLAVAAPFSTASASGSLSVTNNSSANRGNTVTFLLGSEYPALCGYPQNGNQGANPGGGTPTPPRARQGDSSGHGSQPTH